MAQLVRILHSFKKTLNSRELKFSHFSFGNTQYSKSAHFRKCGVSIKPIHSVNYKPYILQTSKFLYFCEPARGTLPAKLVRTFNLNSR
jgi:hypothetical protein